MEAPFWMIYGAGQGAPTVRHASFDAARAEAERLARFCPGIDFFILRAVAAAKKTDVEFRRLDPIGGSIDDNLPF